MPGAVMGKTRIFFFSSSRRHTRLVGDWSSDVCSSDLGYRFESELGLYHASNGLFHEPRSGRPTAGMRKTGTIVAADFDYNAMAAHEPAHVVQQASGTNRKNGA